MFGPLHLAVYKNQIDLVQRLLIQDLEAVEYDKDKDKDKWTPLHQAVYNNNIEITQGLLQYGMDINATCGHFAHTVGVSTPLHVGVAHGSAEILPTILAAGACIGVYDDYGDSPLDKAVNMFLQNSVQRSWYIVESQWQDDLIKIWTLLASGSQMGIGNAVLYKCARLETSLVAKEQWHLIEVLWKTGYRFTNKSKTKDRVFNIKDNGSVNQLIINNGYACYGLLEYYNRQMLSLEDTAALVVRCSLLPNALYGVTCLGLPAALVRTVLLGLMDVLDIDNQK